MTHLTPDELIDALDGVGHRSHLADCDRCRRELAEIVAVLGEAKQARVPEPSPLFWVHFAARVRTAIERDGRPGGTWPSWLRWQALLPLGAAAMITFGLMVPVVDRDRAEGESAAALAAPVAPAAPALTDTWVVVADLVGEMDLDTATAAGVVAPGVAEQAVSQLTADEQQELTRLLKAELTRAKS